MKIPDKETPPDPNPSGICMCGCGEPVDIATYTNVLAGIYRGNHLRYRPHHHLIKRTPLYVEEDRGYTTPCWIWQRAISHRDHNGIHKVNGKPVLAHRWVYEQQIGELPDDMSLDEMCGIKACVNPEHRELIPQSEMGRRRARSILTPENVREIRSMAELGASEISRRLHLARPAVYAVIRGKSWRNIT